MTFEDELRRRLHTNATDLDLHGHGPDATIGRARQRRHRRNAALGTVSGFALIAGTVGVVATRDPSDGQLAVGTLPSAGPLQLEWSQVEGGVVTPRTTAIAPDGSIYALSTAPGASYQESEGQPDTLYVLDDDGDWSTLSTGDGDALVDVAAGSSLLYGISTTPAENGTSFGVRLSTSGDKGGSWSAEDFPGVELPSTSVAWRPMISVAVEARGSTAVAIVSTAFYLPDGQLPGVQGLDTQDLMRTYTDEGIVLSRVDRATPPVTTDAGRTIGAEGIPEVTVPWSALGVSGTADLARTDVFVDTGSGWRRVVVGPAGLEGLASFSVIGDEFVVSGYQTVSGTGEVETAPTYASADGDNWRTVAVPANYGPLTGLGDLWVLRSGDGTQLQVSADRGATWRPVTVPTELLEGGSGPYSVGTLAGGPLGLAVAVVGEDGRPVGVLVTRDLRDWASFDLDGVGGQIDYDYPTIVVGEDRIVVTVTIKGDAEAGDPSRSRTFVGTPVRTTEGSNPSTTVTTAPAAEPPPIVTSSTTTSTLAPSTTTSAVVAGGAPASTTSTAAP
jgi:hypothetical protein